MENRLKERLTGAAILVALIVLLVPEMFRGQGSEPAPPSSNAEGPPVRSYTIDLANNPAHTTPLQQNTASAAAPAKPEPAAVSPNAGVAAAASSSPSITASTPASRSSVPTPKTSKPGDSAKLASHSTESPRAELHPTESHPSTVRTSETHPAEAHAAPTTRESESAAVGWGVQLGLFAKRENAEHLVQAAAGKGFAAHVSTPDAKGLFRVYVTGFTDRASAQAEAGRLKTAGFAAAVVAP